MIDELKTAVQLFNEYDTSKMEVFTLSIEFYRLMIDGEEILEGDDYDILDRVKGINRENGYPNF